MIKERKGQFFKDREISWLNFNQRVLQEAADSSNPLLERIRFLAIFSSNLDEFFRVRVAQIIRLQRINGKKSISDYQSSPNEILEEIQQTVLQLQNRFAEIFNQQIIPEMKQEGILLVSGTNLNRNELDILHTYFQSTLLNQLFPVIIDELSQIPHLRDRSIYLAVKMSGSKSKQPPKHAFIEIPVGIVGRFFSLPDTVKRSKRIILLEDIIRLNLPSIFGIFDYEIYDSYVIKLTRDAEFEFLFDDADYSISHTERLKKSLKQRSKGNPTRFVYDVAMPKKMLEWIVRKLNLKQVNLIPGAHYHNFKDFMDFPRVGNPKLYFPIQQKIPVPEFDTVKRMFDAISKNEILIHMPFQSFDYLIRFLREAAIDPKVTTIQISLYRLARNSNVVNALINAVKNGKKVLVLMELQARFDEEANIFWANQLQEAGALVRFGKPGQKVHCKMCLITRKEGAIMARYAHLSTGNYNGVTANLYSDFALFTKHVGINRDLTALADILFLNLKRSSFKHLLVSPDFMKKQFISLIEKETENAKSGKKAGIDAKMNALVDVDIIRKLYEASSAGVRIRLIVRSICCLVPGIRNLSESIEVISIIDRYLEHTRLFIFNNKGKEKIFLSSADWMSRNLINRVEIAFPVYSEENRKLLKEVFNLQWNDAKKARRIDGIADNQYTHPNARLKQISSQEATFNYYKAQQKSKLSSNNRTSGNGKL